MIRFELIYGYTEGRCFQRIVSPQPLKRLWIKLPCDLPGNTQAMGREKIQEFYSHTPSNDARKITLTEALGNLNIQNTSTLSATLTHSPTHSHSPNRPATPSTPQNIALQIINKFNYKHLLFKITLSLSCPPLPHKNDLNQMIFKYFAINVMSWMKNTFGGVYNHHSDL